MSYVKVHNGIGLVEGKASIRDGLQLSISLKSDSDIIGYRAKPYTAKITTEDLISQSYSTKNDINSGSLILSPDAFYILASKEYVSVPSNYAAEMRAYDTKVGEFRAHYAGFFDPGFGHASAGRTRKPWCAGRTQPRDVCDYIASMTDRSAVENHSKLYGKDIIISFIDNHKNIY